MTEESPAAIHGVAIAIRGAGVLLRGRSGAGKSRLAEETAEAARLRGWFGRFVADDRVLVRRRGGRVLLAPHPALAGQVERRGQGLFAVDHEPAVVLRLVVDLVDRRPRSDTPPRLPADGACRTRIAEVEVPLLVLAIGEPGGAQAILERVGEIGA